MKRPVPLEQAVAMVPDGTVVMVGGFMGVGTPMRLIDELVRQRRRNLTLISNDTARPGVGVGRLIGAGLVTDATGAALTLGAALR
ncbi:CoA-transferase [Variovorax sp. PBS-H4]|uniref:CoA-transferase n=1 Tax=Variovorax sp. PBS-H4 TaxID=434008 RepID=UPI0013A5B045|nr:CoA-transferase [Variovorax sp. PBS-H4]